MLITQRDLQMDHPLAMTVEAEMAGLDDPGMHRADRDLVDLGAGNREKFGLADHWAARRKAHRLQPGMAFRLDAVLLADLALEVMGCRAIRCQRWVGAGDQRRTQQDFAMRIVGDCRQQPARVSVTGRPVSSNNRPPSARRARTSRLNAAVSRSGTAAIG